MKTSDKTRLPTRGKAAPPWKDPQGEHPTVFAT